MQATSTNIVVGSSWAMGRQGLGLHHSHCGGVAAVAFAQVGRGGDEEVFDLLDGCRCGI
ncbi:hypothetical protein [Mycobacterium innocens]|uniref:hypothetical protein n=1 Tax=Mycobacterium innocens TaxID=2341083 RepID=UPI00142D580B|nr:hypothetical protein [Mycobacterium innocens]